VREGKPRQLLQWLRRTGHWALLLLISYLLIPLLLGLFRRDALMDLLRRVARVIEPSRA
jgi:hypothetical protein